MAALEDDLTAEFAATADEILTRLGRSREVTAEIERDGFSATAWAAAVEAGWLEALVAEEAGGLGLSLRELGPILSAAGRHLLVGPLGEHAIAGALATSAADGGPTAARLRATLAGERLLGVVDPAALASTAATPELAGGRLTGACELTRFTARADELLVVAAGPTGPLLALVPSGREGVQIAPRASLDPTGELAAVALDGVELADEDVVADGGTATALLARIRAGMRIAVACELSGIADHALALAVAYAKEREQFGRPIGSFQALAHILAEMAREAFGLARVCREAAAADTGETAGREDAALVAKAHAAATARSVVEGSLQVHGGIAFTVEHELHRYYSRVLSLEGLYGERADLHRTLGRRLLEQQGDLWPSWSGS